MLQDDSDEGPLGGTHLSPIVINDDEEINVIDGHGAIPGAVLTSVRHGQRSAPGGSGGQAPVRRRSRQSILVDIPHAGAARRTRGSSTALTWSEDTEASAAVAGIEAAEGFARSLAISMSGARQTSYRGGLRENFSRHALASGATARQAVVDRRASQLIGGSHQGSASSAPEGPPPWPNSGLVGNLSTEAIAASSSANRRIAAESISHPFSVKLTRQEKVMVRPLSPLADGDNYEDATLSSRIGQKRQQRQPERSLVPVREETPLTTAGDGEQTVRLLRQHRQQSMPLPHSTRLSLPHKTCPESSSASLFHSLAAERGPGGASACLHDGGPWGRLRMDPSASRLLRNSGRKRQSQSTDEGEEMAPPKDAQASGIRQGGGVGNHAGREVDEALCWQVAEQAKLLRHKQQRPPGAELPVTNVRDRAALAWQKKQTEDLLGGMTGALGSAARSHPDTTFNLEHTALGGSPIPRRGEPSAAQLARESLDSVFERFPKPSTTHLHHPPSRRPSRRKTEFFEDLECDAPPSSVPTYRPSLEDPAAESKSIPEQSLDNSRFDMRLMGGDARQLALEEVALDALKQQVRCSQS